MQKRPRRKDRSEGILIDEERQWMFATVEILYTLVEYALNDLCVGIKYQQLPKRITNLAYQIYLYHRYGTCVIDTRFHEIHTNIQH